ncbi:MAG: hypothetical protein IJY22_06230 [Clostridia bacterium]|nr:hypothetical protein [Clostridia bacterium]
MYKLSVPLMSSSVNRGNRDIYVRQCREAGVERIFLVHESSMYPIPDDLAENVAFFKGNGFEVGIWLGDTIGHGFALSHIEGGMDASAFPLMVNIQGEERPFAYCPMDAEFRYFIGKTVAKLAATGADTVMLDDDFRMSQHGTEICCACPAHLARIGEILGEPVTLEQLRPHVISGKANKYRNAWMQAQNEGLLQLARDIRAEVDKQNPETLLCTCVAFAPWNVDGTDVAEIVRILAGGKKGLLRLTGAPYWAVKKRQFPLISVFEIARMLAAFVENEGFELMSEGDVYPRPRYTCPASYLELYDAVTRIDGSYDGILKYMFDYMAGPHMETGYLKLHNDGKNMLQALAELFSGGANAGVRIITLPHTARGADLDLTTLDPLMPRPVDGTMLGQCGIPTVYRGKGVCNTAFGENARLMDLSLLADGVMLDATAAVILAERGVDVGLRSHRGLETESITYLCTQDPEYKSFITDGNARALHAELAPDAEPVLFSTTPTPHPMAYRYENKAGQRFLVFLFEANSIYYSTGVGLSGLTKNPAVQNVLHEMLPWVARKPMPAAINGNPEVYMMCRKTENSLSVALFNCFADPVINPLVTLDESYNHIECLNCEASLQGDFVALTSRLYGFNFCAFRVFK